MLEKLQQKFEPQLSLISARFNQLETRDQKALLILGAFAALILVYALIWLPVADKTHNAERSRDAKRSLVEWMQSKESEAMAVSGAQGNKNQTSSAPMLSIINQSAQKNRISLKRFEPEGNAKLRVWVEDVPFNNFILWVQVLESEHQIHVASMSLDNPDQSGRISAKLILNR
ncbi:MAG: type II secretion system protein M [Pseudomonadales bacterium]|nr:type II secretion system protein M [Pseudomonadales bacterium]